VNRATTACRASQIMAQLWKLLLICCLYIAEVKAALIKVQNPSVQERYMPAIVIWHGLGDTCCDPYRLEVIRIVFSFALMEFYELLFSMGALMQEIKKASPTAFVYSIQLGHNAEEDRKFSYLGDLNEQVRGLNFPTSCDGQTSS
jgi:hypothetical protein